MSNTGNDSVQDGGGVGRIDPDEIKMRESDDGPVLEIGDTRVLLEVGYYDGAEGFDSKADPVGTEIDSNPDFSWWLIYKEEEIDGPCMEVTPQILTGGEE